MLKISSMMKINFPTEQVLIAAHNVHRTTTCIRKFLLMLSSRCLGHIYTTPEKPGMFCSMHRSILSVGPKFGCAGLLGALGLVTNVKNTK